MRTLGIVVTGYSAAGKDAVVRELLARSGYSRVRAVTTRGPRPDDVAGVYTYLKEAQFEKLSAAGELLVDTRYRNLRYGIRRLDYANVERRGQVPVMVLTPESAVALSDWSDPSIGHKDTYLTFFISAPDEVLDERLRHRGMSGSELTKAKEDRQADRRYAPQCFCEIDNSRNPAASAAILIDDMWRKHAVGGLLTAAIIRRMIACRVLLEDADPSNVAGASYDLRLGDEYFYQGRIYRLSDTNPFLLIQPYDYAIVTSHEVARMPPNVAGRFDLSVGLFSQGIILSNGPQVDPGFEGPLFCLLFNTSSSPALLKRRQHYATLEFLQTVEPTFRYKGRYKGKQLIDYLPRNATLGAISKLQQEIEEVRRSTQHFHNTVWGFLALLLSIMALIMALLFR